MNEQSCSDHTEIQTMRSQLASFGERRAPMTMSRFESLARRLVLFLGLKIAGAVAGGCQGGPPVVTMPAAPSPAPATPETPSNPPTPTPTPADPTTQTALETDVAEHLARLTALQTVAVGK